MSFTKHTDEYDKYAILENCRTVKGRDLITQDTQFSHNFKNLKLCENCMAREGIKNSDTTGHDVTSKTWYCVKTCLERYQKLWYLRWTCCYVNMKLSCANWMGRYQYVILIPLETLLWLSSCKFIVHFFLSVKLSNNNLRYPVRCNTLALCLIIKNITFCADIWIDFSLNHHNCLFLSTTFCALSYLILQTFLDKPLRCPTIYFLTDINYCSHYSCQSHFQFLHFGMLNLSSKICQENLKCTQTNIQK